MVVSPGKNLHNSTAVRRLQIYESSAMNWTSLPDAFGLTGVSVVQYRDTFLIVGGEKQSGWASVGSRGQVNNCDSIHIMKSHFMILFRALIFDPVKNYFCPLKRAEIGHYMKNGVAMMMSVASFPQCDIDGRLEQ